MKNCLKLASASLLLFIVGCASAPPAPTEPEVHAFEKNAINALRLGELKEAAASIESALNRYQASDDLHGQWRIHLMAARLALRANDHQSARIHSDRVKVLASSLGGNEVRYQTALLLGQVNNDPESWTEAASHANTPLQRAVAQTYLGNVELAVSLVDSELDHPNDRAFVFFQHGVKKNNADSLRKAVDLYRLANDSRGIADSLTSLARLEQRSGNLRAARHYAERAIIVLSAIGDQTRAEAVKAWLDQQ